MRRLIVLLANAGAGNRGRLTFQRTHSPIEAILEDALGKYLHPATRKMSQQPFSTPFGRYHTDFFMAALETRRVLALKCDRRDYRDPLLDRWRDAAMLVSGIVHNLLRIEGEDLARGSYDVLYMLSRPLPSIFQPRALEVLSRVDNVGPVAHCESGLPVREHDGFLVFDLRRTSRCSSDERRLRYCALCDRKRLTSDQLVERERLIERTGYFSIL